MVKMLNNVLTVGLLRWSCKTGSGSFLFGLFVYWLFELRFNVQFIGGWLWVVQIAAKLLGGRNSCFEGKLREGKMAEPKTKGRGTQLIGLGYWYTLER